MIGDPPVLEGGFHRTVTLLLVTCNLTSSGALGTVTGVTGRDGSDRTPGPAVPTAMTLNVYVVPLIRSPTTTDLVAPSVQTGGAGGLGTTWYATMAPPPSSAGGLQRTVAEE